MSLLDPTAIADPDHYTPDDFRGKGLVIRRFKKDIKDQVQSDFQERQTLCLRRAASPQEETAYRALLDVPFTQAGHHRGGRQQELQRVAMQKVLPEAVACMHRHMVQRQGGFAAELNQRLEGTLAELRRLQDRQMAQLSLDLERQLETVRRGRFEQRSQHISRVFDDYRQWVLPGS